MRALASTIQRWWRNYNDKRRKRSLDRLTPTQWHATCWPAR
ncbi:hypothetical protein [Stenotrophomonas bentonitica]